MRKIVRSLWIFLRHLRIQPFMNRADAHAQRSYLQNLPKYKIKATTTTGEPHYLVDPKGEPIRQEQSDRCFGKSLISPIVPPADHQKLEFRETNPADPATTPGEFRFDNTDGYLFLDRIDKHDCMYYAHVKPPSDGFVPLKWERIRLPFDKEPLRFKGKFKRQNDNLCWVMPRGSNRFWDADLEAQKPKVTQVNDFAVSVVGNNNNNNNNNEQTAHIGLQKGSPFSTASLSMERVG
jgi:hypothetical protein